MFHVTFLIEYLVFLILCNILIHRGSVWETRWWRRAGLVHRPQGWPGGSLSSQLCGAGLSPPTTPHQEWLQDWILEHVINSGIHALTGSYYREIRVPRVNYYLPSKYGHSVQVFWLSVFKCCYTSQVSTTWQHVHEHQCLLQGGISPRARPCSQKCSQQCCLHVTAPTDESIFLH